jgi:hypothetical protein
MLHRVLLQTLIVRWVLAWCTLAQASLYTLGGTSVTAYRGGR